MNFKKSLIFLSFFALSIVVFLYQPEISLSQLEPYNSAELTDPNFNWNTLDANRIDENNIRDVWNNWEKVPKFKQQELLQKPVVQERIRSEIGMRSFSGCENAACSYNKETGELRNGNIAISSKGLKNAKVTALKGGGFRIEGPATTSALLGGVKQEIKTEGIVDIKNDGTVSGTTKDSKITLQNGVAISGQSDIDRDGRINLRKWSHLDYDKHGIHISSSSNDLVVSIGEKLPTEYVQWKNEIYIDTNGNVAAHGKRMEATAGTGTYSPYTIYIGKDTVDYGFEFEINANSNGLDFDLGTIMSLTEINAEGKMTTIFFDGERYDIYSGYLLLHNKGQNYANVQLNNIEALERLKEALKGRLSFVVPFYRGNEDILTARVQPILERLNAPAMPIKCGPPPSGYRCKWMPGTIFWECTNNKQITQIITCDQSTGQWQIY